MTYSDWNTNITGKDIVTKLTKIVEEYKKYSGPVALTVSPAFYNKVVEGIIDIEINLTNNTLVNHIPYCTGIKTEVFSKLPIPWKAYYTWKEFELDKSSTNN